MDEHDKTELFERLRQVETGLATHKAECNLLREQHKASLERICRKLDDIKAAAERDREAVGREVRTLLEEAWARKGVWWFVGALVTIVGLAASISGVIVAVMG